MRVVPWRAVVLAVGGVLIGLAVAGLPTQTKDPPIQVRQVEASSTTVPVVVTTTTTSTTVQETTTTTSRTGTTRTTRRP